MTDPRIFTMAVMTVWLAAALPGSAQEAFDPGARAKAAGNAARLGSGSAVFSNEGISENLPIYEGTDTPETAIGKNNIEAKTREALTGGSSAAGIYETMNDSIELRPKYDLGTDYIGIVNGDAAHTNAEDIAGQYFSSDETENPACDFTDFSVLEPFERYCDVHSSMTETVCTIERVVEVDRRDNWRCEVANTTVTVECAPNASGNCEIGDQAAGGDSASCTLRSEECLEEELVAVREPWRGSYKDLGVIPIFGNPQNIVYGATGRDNTMCYWWAGQSVGCSKKKGSPSDHEHHSGGWIYQVADCEGSFSRRHCGIYRRKGEGRPHMLADPPVGGYLGAETGAFFGWQNPATGGPLWWAGRNLGVQKTGYVEGECVYTAAGAQGSVTPPGGGAVVMNAVQRTCATPPACLRKRQEYHCPQNDQCAGLAAAPACEVKANSCLVTENGKCSLERFDYSCLNDLADHAPALLLESKIERIEDKLVNSCDPAPDAEGCLAGESVCVSGEAVHEVMGFPISRDCWSYEQRHQCVGDGDAVDYTDCGPFRADPSCKVISQTCLSYDEEEGEAPVECRHWEYGYRCGGGMELPEECTAMNVCVGGLCEGIEHEANTDFGNAAAWLTMLDEAAKDSEKSLDMQDVQLFAGTGRNCKVGALGTINCCKDSGWANGILGDCSESELALMDRIQAKAAVYVGTYCSRKVLGVCLQKRRSYCTFNSQLGMVFQKEIRRLAGTGWGSAKRPNCAGLALDEIDSINWDEIDLSEAFGDMMNDAAVPTADMVTDYLRDRLELTAGAVSKGE